MLLVSFRSHIAKIQAEGPAHASPQAPLPPLVMPELGLTVEVVDPVTPLPICVVGRADWGLSYCKRKRAEEGTVVGVIEAK